MDWQRLLKYQTIYFNNNIHNKFRLLPFHHASFVILWNSYEDYFKFEFWKTTYTATCNTLFFLVIILNGDGWPQLDSFTLVISWLKRDSQGWNWAVKLAHQRSYHWATKSKALSWPRNSKVLNLLPFMYPRIRTLTRRSQLRIPY